MPSPCLGSHSQYQWSGLWRCYPKNQWKHWLRSILAGFIPSHILCKYYVEWFWVMSMDGIRVLIRSGFHLVCRYFNLQLILCILCICDSEYLSMCPIPCVVSCDTCVHADTNQTCSPFLFPTNTVLYRAMLFSGKIICRVEMHCSFIKSTLIAQSS